MRRSRKIVIRTIGVIVCLTILATPVWLYLINEYVKDHGLVSPNIYAVEEDWYNPKFKTKRITYMICRPETSEEKLKAQIDEFLSENEIVSTLTKNHNGCIEVLYIHFIRPTDFIRAGETGEFYGEPLPFDGEMRLCKITIDGAELDNWRYEFFPENFEKQQ